MAQHLSADDHAESFRGSPLYMVSTHNWDTGNCVLHVFVCSVNIYCGHIPSIMQERIWVGGEGGGGGAWGPLFGTEQALHTEVYRVLNAYSYSNTAHISI